MTGGAITCLQCNLHLTNSTFEQSLAMQGGAFYIIEPLSEIYFSNIVVNYARGYLEGGAFYIAWLN